MGMPLLDWIVQNSLAVFGTNLLLAGFVLLIFLVGIVAMMRMNGLISFMFFGGLISMMALPKDKGGLGILPLEAFLLVVFLTALVYFYGYKRFADRRQ